mmetsp:Transcript_15971/g.22472  ORF Transcript_15971/g.22472 Transcript_15971/m.22472 type:complete len:433 (-) Transcript_15971:102-1400(-)
MDVIPHRSLGPFRIGSNTANVIKYIQQNGMTLRSNSLSYDPSNPLDSDLTLTLHNVGLRLRFDPVSQRLKLIEVYDVSKCAVAYAGIPLSGKGVAPTCSIVYRTFGPTFPGTCDTKRNVYMLQYPGVSFMFPLGSKGQKLIDRADQKGVPELPLEFETGGSPVASRIFIHHGPHVAEMGLPRLGLNSVYFEPVVGYLGRGLYFVQRKVFIGFDSHVQDCLTDLGPPQRVFVKGLDKMRIHFPNWPMEHQPPDSSEGHELLPVSVVGSHHYRDYFFNYFDLGFDLLFDGCTHRVAKIVLHTNFPGQHLFNRYRKSNFRIVVDRARKPPLQPSWHNPVQADLGVIDDLNRVVSYHSTGRSKESCATVGPDCKWDRISNCFGSGGTPMVNSGPRKENPFGSTLFYAYNGILFEVMSNHHLKSATLFPQTIRDPCT